MTARGRERNVQVRNKWLVGWLEVDKVGECVVVVMMIMKMEFLWEWRGDDNDIYDKNEKTFLIDTGHFTVGKKELSKDCKENKTLRSAQCRCYGDEDGGGGGSCPRLLHVLAVVQLQLLELLRLLLLLLLLFPLFSTFRDGEISGDLSGWTPVDAALDIELLVLVFRLMLELLLPRLLLIWSTEVATEEASGSSLAVTITLRVVEWWE